MGWQARRSSISTEGHYARTIPATGMELLAGGWARRRAHRTTAIASIAIGSSNAPDGSSAAAFGSGIGGNTSVGSAQCVGLSMQVKFEVNSPLSVPVNVPEPVTGDVAPDWWVAMPV
jgi:hypothetical protein